MEIARIDASALEHALPLIADYQRFYEVEPDGARNAAFFRRFVDSDGQGTLLGARDAGGSLLGFACLHWRLDTVEAREIVCLHDLYVVPEARGTGAGRALLEGRGRGRTCARRTVARLEHCARQHHGPAPLRRDGRHPLRVGSSTTCPCDRLTTSPEHATLVAVVSRPGGRVSSAPPLVREGERIDPRNVRTP